MRVAGVQAVRVLQEAQPAASVEAAEGSEDACSLADDVAPQVSQPARTAACRSPDADSDLEAEQRVNAEMKERYKRLAERAAIELDFNGALAASCAGAAVRLGLQPEARGAADEEEEEGGTPSPARRTTASESAQKHAAEGRRLTLRVNTQMGAFQRLRIAPREPLSKLFAAFQQHAVREGWMPEDAQPSFWFDGERLGGEATAEGVELEDEFVIDCNW